MKKISQKNFPAIFSFAIEKNDRFSKKEPSFPVLRGKSLRLIARFFALTIFWLSTMSLAADDGQAPAETVPDASVPAQPSLNDAPEQGLASAETFVFVSDFGAVPDGKTDNTAAFQAALDSLGPQGGMVVVSKGNYFFSGHLNVPQGVTLQGSWSSITSHNGCRDKGLPLPTDDGTTFLVTENEGNEEGPAFITLNTNSTLSGVVLYWPNQKTNDIPAAYPWGIAMRGKNPAVLEVEILNPYNGIDASHNERALIRNVHGQPLRRGIYVDFIYDIGRIENVHFNPWWSMQPKLYEWQRQHGEAFIFEKTDWHYVLNTFCFGYSVGYRFGGSKSGVCNGNFLGIGADACHTSVLVEKSSPIGILITNGEFVAFEGDDPTMVVVTQENQGTVRFVNSSFWGPCEQIAKIAGSGTIGFGDCTFLHWDRKNAGKAAIQADGGNVLIRGCEFKKDGSQIELGENVQRAIVSENLMQGDVRIADHAQSSHIDGNLGTTPQ